MAMIDKSGEYEVFSVAHKDEWKPENVEKRLKELQNDKERQSRIKKLSLT